MTKYLDSKGLSYLWQKIRGTYVAKDAVIKLGSEDTTGVSLVKATAASAKDSWTIPFATIETVTEGESTKNLVKQGIVRSGVDTFNVPGEGVDTTWHKAPIVNGYVWYENTLASTDTVTSNESKDLTDNYVILGAGDKKVKASAYLIGAESYTAPATFGGSNLLATEAAVKSYADSVTSGLQLSYADGTNTLAGKKVIKLTDTNNAALSYELDATPFIKDGMLESVQILKYTVTTTGEGEESVTTRAWKTLEGAAVEGLIDTPSNAADDSIWMYFVWNTDVDVDGNQDGVQRKVSWLPATDLIKDCSADGDRGIAADTNEDGGNKFYVKTTGIEDGKVANVTTGFDGSGNVVGYVDVESYFEAFDKDDLDAIIASADALYEADPTLTPKYPENDPLATATPGEGA